MTLPKRLLGLAAALLVFQATLAAAVRGAATPRDPSLDTEKLPGEGRVLGPLQAPRGSRLPLVGVLSRLRRLDKPVATGIPPPLPPDALHRPLAAAGWNGEQPVAPSQDPKRPWMQVLNAGMLHTSLARSPPARRCPHHRRLTAHHLASAPPLCTPPQRQPINARPTPHPPHHTEARIFLFHNFLTDAECDQIIARAKPKLERSGVVDSATGGSEVSDIRTSAGMFFER